LRGSVGSLLGGWEGRRRGGVIRVQRIIPIRIRNAETLAATDPIQIEEGALSPSLPLLG
jgi:hypothetical protein